MQILVVTSQFLLKGHKMFNFLFAFFSRFPRLWKLISLERKQIFFQSFFLFITHIQTLHTTFYKPFSLPASTTLSPLCTGQRWTTSFDTKIRSIFYHERDSYSSDLMLQESVLRFTLPNKQGSEVYEFQANPLSESFWSFPLNPTPWIPTRTMEDIFSLALSVELKIQSWPPTLADWRFRGLSQAFKYNTQECSSSIREEFPELPL